jgi:uncharacterized protein (TIGR02117 family)
MRDKTPTTHAMYVSNHGWHTSIILPAKDVQQQEPALKQRFADAAYLGFGWGDASVYQADEVHFLPATVAILLPTNAVIHVVATATPKPNQDTQTLCLSNSHYQSLIQYILSSFTRDAQHHIMPTALDDGENSQFYYAQGSYYYLNTCNTWTAKALKSAGLDITPVFYPTASQVMRRVKDAAKASKQSCLHADK